METKPIILRCLRKLERSAIWFIRRYIRRNPRLIVRDKYYKNGVGEKLRLEYPLTEKSLVFDIGGFDGKYSECLNAKYRPNIKIFEPQNKYFEMCNSKFRSEPKIDVMPFGLGNLDECVSISLDGKKASVYRVSKSEGEIVEIRSIGNLLEMQNIQSIDLAKINIEGGEYDLLESLLESGKISQFRYLQIQFHKFVPNALERRESIREALSKTHEEMWNYEFVWESWRRCEEGDYSEST